MHCRIATTRDISLLRDFVSKPREDEWVYRKPLYPPLKTELFEILEAKYNIPTLQGVFQAAERASTELGTWCANQIWAIALADDVLPKIEGSIRKNAHTESKLSEQTQTEIDSLRKASDTVKEYISDHLSDPMDVSSKAELLFSKLREQFIKLPKTKCIVFTERRDTAKLLSLLCEQRKIPNLYPDFLIGVRKGDDMGLNVTFRRQFLALMKFRNGEVNCLVCVPGDKNGLSNRPSLQQEWRKKVLTYPTATWL